MLLELRDTSFRTEADVLDVLSLPVLAIGAVRRDRRREECAAQRRRLAVSAAGVACVAGAGYVTWTLKLWNSLI